MIPRLVVLCAFLQVLSIVASSGNVPVYNVNSGGLLKATESAEGRKEERTSLHNVEDEKKKIDDLEASGNLYETRRDQSEDSEIPWFEKVPLLPVAYARSSTLPDGPCKKQAQRYLRDLKNGTLWATQMYDASTKYPDGLISGQLRHFGDFDGCYNLEVKLANHVDDDVGVDEEISGRYCLVDIEYEKRGLPPVDPHRRLDLVFDPNDSVWEAIREKGDTRRKMRYNLRVALCVPEVCSHSDIEAALQEPVKSFGAEQNLKINVNVKPYFSQARKDVGEFTRDAKIYCSIVAVLIALVVIGTCYDFRLKDDQDDAGSTARDFALCFSARRNFNTIMRATSSHPGLETIQLMRFFFITLVIAGHRNMQYWMGPLINTNYMEKWYEYRWSMQLLGGPIIVDGLFAIGGLLLSYSLLTELDAKKKIDFFGIMFARFLRLTPAYMMVVFFCALILPHMGSGPLWEWKIGMERDYCANNWWTNLLFVNNFVNLDRICLFPSWYLAIDYQLFAMALIVIYLFWRMPRKYGYAFLCAIIIGGCITLFVNTYVYGAPPLYILSLSMEDVRACPQYLMHYCKTQQRIASYFIGILVGAVLYDHGRYPWQLGTILSNILFFLLVVVFSIGSQYLGYNYFDPNAKPTLLESAFYAALSKAAFAIATCTVPLLMTVGTGLTFHYNILNPRWCQPLSRLTYGAFLVHFVIQLYDVGVTRASRTFTFHNGIWDCVQNVVFTYIVSLILTLIVEGPFRRLEKRFIMKSLTSVKSNGVKKEAKKTN